MDEREYLISAVMDYAGEIRDSVASDDDYKHLLAAGLPQVYPLARIFDI